MNWQTLYEIAAAQHGVVALRDAARAGVPERTLRARAAAEGWRRPHPGVFLLPGAPWDFSQRAAAALAAVPAAVVAGWSACFAWGLTQRPPRRLQLLLPYGAASHPLHGVHLHRSRRLSAEDATTRDGLAITTPSRTLCDVSMWAGRRQLGELVATTVTRELAVIAEIELLRVSLGPRRGSSNLRAVLARLAADGRTDSALERQIRRVLRNAGLRPAPGVYAVRIDGVLLGRVDIAFPEARVGIEVDGFAWHRTPAQLRRDHERQNAFLAAGWRLLRVSAADVADPERFLAALRALLAS